MTIPAGQSPDTLGGAVDYFERILEPNRAAFFGSPSTFVNAFNLATALFHFHEWLFAEFKIKLEKEFGATFRSKGAFWRAVEGTDSRFGYIRDIANASKHVTIGGKGFAPPSTGMTHIANTHIIAVGYGQGGYGQGRYGGGPSVVFDDSGNQVNFDDCAGALFIYWKSLLAKLT